tara:strand:- start:96 stop:335 length:240 start_codon:yes stop_codon:yes gene_type:complete
MLNIINLTPNTYKMNLEELNLYGINPNIKSFRDELNRVVIINRFGNNLYSITIKDKKYSTITTDVVSESLKTYITIKKI